MSANPGFQISLDVRGRVCLVIGGDEEAAEKAGRLLDAGAKVVVVHPTLNDTLRKLTASGKILHRGRRFRSTDTQGVLLILNVLREDTDLSKSLFDLANVERFLVWSMDQPELSTLSLPAVVSRGRLRVGISTSGASPSLASTLRQQAALLFDDEFVEFLDWLGALRDQLREQEPNEAHRRERLKAAVQGFHLHGRLEYPKAWSEEKARRKSTA